MTLPKDLVTFIDTGLYNNNHIRLSFFPTTAADIINNKIDIKKFTDDLNKVYNQMYLVTGDKPYIDDSIIYEEFCSMSDIGTAKPCLNRYNPYSGALIDQKVTINTNFLFWLTKASEEPEVRATFIHEMAHAFEGHEKDRLSILTMPYNVSLNREAMAELITLISSFEAGLPYSPKYVVNIGYSHTSINTILSRDLELYNQDKYNILKKGYNYDYYSYFNTGINARKLIGSYADKFFAIDTLYKNNLASKTGVETFKEAIRFTLRHRKDYERLLTF